MVRAVQASEMTEKGVGVNVGWRGVTGQFTGPRVVESTLCVRVVTFSERVKGGSGAKSLPSGVLETGEVGV